MSKRLENDSAIGVVHALVDVGSLTIKYVSTNRDVLEEIRKNESVQKNVGRLEVVSRIVAFEMPPRGGIKK